MDKIIKLLAKHNKCCELLKMNVKRLYLETYHDNSCILRNYEGVLIERFRTKKEIKTYLNKEIEKIKKTLTNK